MKGLEDKVTGIKKTADEMKDIADTPIKNPRRPGGPLDPKIGIVRAAVREILHKNLKAGKINIPDAAEKKAIERYMANKDPIDIFRKTYGEDALEAIDSVADNLLEIDQAGGSYAGINKFLQDNKLFDFVPKKTYGYDESIVSADKILKQAEQDAKNKKILEDFDIDPDREPNADGGIIGNLRLNRTGFNDGSEDPKISRRKFMKIIGGLAALPVVGKFFKLAKPAAGLVKSVGSGTTPPSYFFNLINKIKIMGDDVTPKYATQERQRVTKYKDFELTEDIATGEKTIKKFKASELDEGPPNMTEETYMNYKPGKSKMDETTKGKTPPDEYTEDTTFIRNDRENAGEIYNSVDGVGDDIIMEVEAGSGSVPESFYTGPNPIKKIKKASGGRVPLGTGKLVKGLGELAKKLAKEKA